MAKKIITLQDLLDDSGVFREIRDAAYEFSIGRDAILKHLSAVQIQKIKEGCIKLEEFAEQLKTLLIKEYRKMLRYLGEDPEDTRKNVRWEPQEGGGYALYNIEGDVLGTIYHSNFNGKWRFADLDNPMGSNRQFDTMSDAKEALFKELGIK